MGLTDHITALNKMGLLLEGRKAGLVELYVLCGVVEEREEEAQAGE